MNCTLAKNFTGAALALLITTNCSAGFLVKTVRRGAGVYFAHQAYKNSAETQAAYNKFSQEIENIRTEVAKKNKDQKSSLPFCEEAVSVGSEAATHIRNHITQKYITTAPEEKAAQSMPDQVMEKVAQTTQEIITTVVPQDTPGKVLCENGAILIREGAKAVAAVILIKG